MTIENYIHPVHQVYDGTISSASRRKIDLKNPTAEMICIEDIATGLNNICRFGGQIKEFYSVLQHSLLVMALAPAELKKVALLHDAAEAYLGDVVKPLKVIIGSVYEELEDNFQKAIFEKFNLDMALLKEIKPFDRQALTMEHDHFFDIRRSPVMPILNDMVGGNRPMHPYPIADAFKVLFMDLLEEMYDNRL